MVFEIFFGKKRLALSAALLAFAFCPAVGTWAAQPPPNLGPPAGLTATKMTLARLFQLHRVALGVLPPSTPKTSIEHWKYSAEGLSGTQVRYVSGADVREDDVLGPFQSSFGELRGQKWRQNENGLTLMLHGVHKEADINAAALRDFAKNRPSVKLVGETAQPVSAYVVEINPPGGRHEWVFYDKSSLLIARKEAIWEDQRVVTTYDDFRATNGVTQPWHIHMTDGRSYNDEDLALQVLEVGVPLDPSKVSIPTDRRSVYAMPADKVALTATIIADQVVLPVKINGHTENFQLDSGASGIVIDHDVARDIGLKNYGRTTGATAGTYVMSRTVIPQATLGEIQVNDLVVETLPFDAMLDAKTRIVGLLGFDFIAGAVIHVDYLHGTVEAINAAKFTTPQKAISVPVALDDGVPFVQATIGSARAEHFIVDTGAFRSALFSSFATKNASAVADQGLGESIEAAFPFVNHITGVGGRSVVRPTQVKDFGFAGLRFPQWLFLASQKAAAFEGEDADGLIGQDFLRNFDLYLDYAHERILLVPNERYYTRWPAT